MGERWENCGLWDDGRAAGSILVIDAGNRVKRVIISLPISCVSTLLLNGSCRRTTQPYDRFGFKQTSRWQHNDQSGQVVCGRPFPRSYKKSSMFSRKDDQKRVKNGTKKEKEFCNYLFMRLLQNSLVPGTGTPQAQLLISNYL